MSSSLGKKFVRHVLQCLLNCAVLSLNSLSVIVFFPVLPQSPHKHINKLESNKKSDYSLIQVITVRIKQQLSVFVGCLRSLAMCLTWRVDDNIEHDTVEGCQSICLLDQCVRCHFSTPESI